MTSAPDVLTFDGPPNGGSSCVWAGALVIALAVAGCGGGGEKPDDQDIARIHDSATSVLVGCGLHQPIEEPVNVLLQEADEAGDAEFVYDGHRTTVPDLLDELAKVMADMSCQPGEQKRLREGP